MATHDDVVANAMDLRLIFIVIDAYMTKGAKDAQAAVNSNSINLHTHPWTKDRHDELLDECNGGLLHGINGSGCECTFCMGVMKNWKEEVAGPFYANLFSNFYTKYGNLLHSTMSSITESDAKFKDLLDFLGEIQCAARAKPHKSKLKGIGDVMFGKILAIMRVMINRPWEQYCIPIDTP